MTEIHQKYFEFKKFEFLVLKLTMNPVWILASKDGVSVTLLVANICWPGMSKLEAYYNFAALALAHEWRICFERRNDSFTNVVTKTLSKRCKNYVRMTFRHRYNFYIPNIVTLFTIFKDFLPSKLSFFLSKHIPNFWARCRVVKLPLLNIF